MQPFRVNMRCFISAPLPLVPTQMNFQKIHLLHERFRHLLARFQIAFASTNRTLVNIRFYACGTSE